MSSIPVSLGRVVTTRNHSGVIFCHIISTGVMVEVFPDGRIIIRDPLRRTITKIDAVGKLVESVTA